MRSAIDEPIPSGTQGFISTAHPSASKKNRTVYPSVRPCYDNAGRFGRHLIPARDSRTTTLGGLVNGSLGRKQFVVVVVSPIGLLDIESQQAAAGSRTLLWVTMTETSPEKKRWRLDGYTSHNDPGQAMHSAFAPWLNVLSTRPTIRYSWGRRLKLRSGHKSTNQAEMSKAAFL